MAGKPLRSTGVNYVEVIQFKVDNIINNSRRYWCFSGFSGFEVYKKPLQGKRAVAIIIIGIYMNIYGVCNNICDIGGSI